MRLNFTGRPAVASGTAFHSGPKVGVIVGSIMGVLFLLLCIGLGCLWRSRRAANHGFIPISQDAAFAAPKFYVSHYPAFVCWCRAVAS